jgi:hypothetical protein
MDSLRIQKEKNKILKANKWKQSILKLWDAVKAILRREESVTMNAYIKN